MPINENAINDFISQTKAVNQKINRLLDTISISRNTDVTNKLICQQMQEVGNLIQTAKIQSEYLKDHFNKNLSDVSPAMMNALKIKTEQLEIQTAHLQNVRMQMMKRITPSKEDPLYQMLLATPKAPTIDPTEAVLRSAPRAPTENVIIGALVKDTLDKLIEKSKESSPEKLDANDRKLIVQAAMQTLKTPEEKLEFSKVLRDEINRRNLEVLKSIHVPKTEPRVSSPPPKEEVKPAVAPPLSDIELRAKELARMPFADVKKALREEPDANKRWELMKAIREEVENNKLKATMPPAPTDVIKPPKKG